MKRSMVLPVFIAVALSLTGCGPDSAGKKSSETTLAENSEAAAAQATAEAAQPGSREPELVFKYGEVNPEENIIAKVGFKFAEYVDELSDGRIKIEVYPSDALGDEKHSLYVLQRGGGQVDMYRGNTSQLTGYGFKNLNLFGLPYVFESREGMWKVLEDEELGRKFLSEGSEIGAGMVGLFYTDEGPRNLFTSREIKGLEDIRNKKIRVQESVLMMDTISALGAQPVPMPYSEVYGALGTGAIDGAENPLTAYISSRFYEVAPYYLMSEHVYSPGIVLMAEEKWNALSEEDKNILLKAGEMASQWNKEQIEEEEETLRGQLDELGVIVIEMTPEERERAEQEEAIVRTSFTPGLEDLLNRMIEVQNIQE
ncbi:MAG: TRAP transporter substrate-binding protein [Lacrimispora sp.]|uniref:TRAP transporter substrate-binding protein n=1 Tax=Lacrimispora sp. TaxID=2719234 RepID=UPI0039E41986